MAKVDAKSAYCNVPVHPDDRWLMGMMWDGALYVDTALPFGLCSAPKIFTTIADAVEWIVRQEGVKFAIHCLDYSLVVGALDSPECAEALDTLRRVFSHLGLPVAIEKLEGPWYCLNFLGFELDSLSMVIRLPQAELTELQQLIQSWVHRRSCTRGELESLVGKLAHASKVVQPGKTFMRRMFELLAGTRQAHHHSRLSVSFRSDLLWWATFLESWNGVALMQSRSQSHQGPSHHVGTDASGHLVVGQCGLLLPTCGCSCGGMGHTRQWDQLRNESITLKELLPIVLPCSIWGRHWRGSAVTFHCDNVAAVAVVNSGYSRVPQILHLLRCLFFHSGLVPDHFVGGTCPWGGQ